MRVVRSSSLTLGNSHHWLSHNRSRYSYQGRRGDCWLSGNNTYTGSTKVVQGGLVAGSTNAFGTGLVVINGAGCLLCRYSESMLPHGVELGGAIEFANNGAVKVELAGGVIQPPGAFSVPLFLLPEGESISAEAVPLEHTFESVSGAVVTSAVGAKTLISAEFTFTGGTVILIK